MVPLRPLVAMVNEAVIALQEGVASARDIDFAMAAGTGFPSDKIGPLHLADQRYRSRASGGGASGQVGHGSGRPDVTSFGGCRVYRAGGGEDFFSTNQPLLE